MVYIAMNDKLNAINMHGRKATNQTIVGIENIVVESTNQRINQGMRATKPT